MSVRLLAPVLRQFSKGGIIITHPKFSDFAPASGKLEGEKMKLADILDKEILVTGYAVHKSKFKDEMYLTLQFEFDNVKRVLFTGSGVLTNQIETYADKIPFFATVKNFGKYFAFT